MEVNEGSLDGSGLRIAIIQSSFNQMITDTLRRGAIEGLVQNGVSEDSIKVYIVPGALEIPLILQEVARRGNFDGAVCVGAVIQGDTAHFDVVVDQSADGISRVSLEQHFPVSNGVLTTNTVEQAMARAGGKAGNKGMDASLALLSTINLLGMMRGKTNEQQ